MVPILVGNPSIEHDVSNKNIQRRLNSSRNTRHPITGRRLQLSQTLRDRLHCICPDFVFAVIFPGISRIMGQQQAIGQDQLERRRRAVRTHDTGLEVNIPVVLFGQIVLDVGQSNPAAKLASQLFRPILSGAAFLSLEKKSLADFGKPKLSLGSERLNRLRVIAVNSDGIKHGYATLAASATPACRSRWRRQAQLARQQVRQQHVVQRIQADKKTRVQHGHFIHRPLP